ncbi:hypothetical protein E4U53_002539 [Claviceps sorghi]|nr:hypothetical protein E4U53_002539 [Claviceps sorghi]
MDPCGEAQEVPSMLPHNVRLLGDAVNFLLDANDTTSLSVLASRLAPFRIDLKETLVGETLSLQPVLVFEDGYNARDNGILSPRAGHLCPRSGRGLDAHLAFDGASGTPNESLYDSWDLFGFENALSGSDLDCQAYAQDESMLELETQQETNHRIHSRSGSRCHASSEAAMLDHMIYPCRQHGQPGSLSAATAGNASSILNMTPVAATERPGLRGQDTRHGQASPASGRNHEADGRERTQEKNGKASRFLADATPCKVLPMVRTCLRPDHDQFLKTNLPRWVRDGLWHNDWSQSHGAGSRPGRFANLQRVYSCFCQLDVRMRDDAIRGRMVMVLLHLEFEKMYHDWRSGRVKLAGPVTSMGRGNISAVIDSILEKAHPEWCLADSKQRAAFRAKFHNRKRHGKRWWMLMDALGPSVLLLCSSRFAGAMKNTTVTASMIQALPAAIQNYEPKVTQVLNVVNPIAKSLFHDRGYRTHAVDDVLRQVKALGPI